MDSSFVQSSLEKGFLLSSEFLDQKEISLLSSCPSLVFFPSLPSDLRDVHWSSFDHARVLHEKYSDSSLYSSFLESFQSLQSPPVSSVAVSISLPEIPVSSSVNLVKGYTDSFKKKNVQDFVLHYRARYESLQKILLARVDLQNSISITRLQHKQHGEEVCLIGLIIKKTETKNGNIRLTLEDLTGTVDVLINKTKEDIHSLVLDCVLDEVVGIKGALGQNVVFCNQFYLPDVPEGKEFKKSSDEVYAAFISDIHVGLNVFLEEEFKNFIQWTRGEYGGEKHKEYARKLQYLFLIGDLIEGVGIYPNQEEELNLPDVHLQYAKLAEYLRQIPPHIQLIICGGNHDALRLSEPQPKIDKTYASPLYELANATFVTNPSIVNIHKSADFPGFDVLMYHGFSLIYYGDVVPSLRQAGGLDRTDLIMKYLLQRRHLGPAHGSSLYIPDPEVDPRVIDIVPDIFVTGHVHRACAMNYKGVTLLNSSCWAKETGFMQKMGITPTPARVPLLNLKTREIKFMNFYRGEA